VLIHCFDARQMVLVFIEREAIDDYFRSSALTPHDRNLLIDRNFRSLIPVITGKYNCGEVGIIPGLAASSSRRSISRLPIWNRHPRS
jgi:hypothetical protein